MKKLAFPVVLAIVLVFVDRAINSKFNSQGYVIAIFMGLAIGAIINNLVFRKEALEKKVALQNKEALERRQRFTVIK